MTRLCLPVLASLLGSLPLAAQEIPWEGRGNHRILVEAPAMDIGARKSDELVAAFDLDLDLLPNLPPSSAIDFDSLQVMRISAETGRAEPFGNHAYSSSPWDRPFQFYDATYPHDFPNYERYLSHQKTNPFQRPKLIPYGARHFNAIGTGRKGRLVWSHIQLGQCPAVYAVYFNLTQPGTPPVSPPAGFVGDGSPRMLRESNRFGPPGNINGRVVDWNRDGLPDLLFGSSDGHISLYLNTGKPGEPQFRRKTLLFDEANVPIDVGFSSCPWLIDWDGDGRRDLLTAAEKGCVVWFRNARSDTIPKFQFAGFLEADRKMIVTPNHPIAEGRNQEAFKEDYFPVPLPIDWDGDGDSDLLLGGYVTGLTFYYENTAGTGHPPVLHARGPLLDAEGNSIDTGWMAAPAAADLDSDGDLDLILGAKPVGTGGGDVSDSSRAILCYINHGTRESPRLVRTSFPATTTPPFGGMIVPSLTDWDGDGLTDLVVVDVRQRVSAFRNVGTATQPLFDFKARPLTGTWQHEGLHANAFVDINADGLLDILNGFNAMLSDGKPSPGSFSKRISFTAGKTIQHPVPYGDENPGRILHDMNGDGTLDGVYGAHSGHLWLHLNRGTNLKPDLDAAGDQLRHLSGTVLKVGLPEGTRIEKLDFTTLQGARPKPVAADFNSDGLPDLIVGDAYGKVRYFENRGTASKPLFADPVLIDDRHSRLYLGVLDWNGDGTPDLAVLKGGIRVFVNKGHQGRCEFEPPEEVRIPQPMSYILSLSAMDWNQDGDEDLLYLSADGAFCFAERSFLKFGYVEAKALSVTTRP